MVRNDVIIELTNKITFDIITSLQSNMDSEEKINELLSYLFNIISSEISMRRVSFKFRNENNIKKRIVINRATRNYVNYTKDLTSLSTKAEIFTFIKNHLDKNFTNQELEKLWFTLKI